MILYMYTGFGRFRIGIELYDGAPHQHQGGEEEEECADGCRFSELKAIIRRVSRISS